MRRHDLDLSRTRLECMGLLGKIFVHKYFAQKTLSKRELTATPDTVHASSISPRLAPNCPPSCIPIQPYKRCKRFQCNVDDALLLLETRIF